MEATDLHETKYFSREEKFDVQTDTQLHLLKKSLQRELSTCVHKGEQLTKNKQEGEKRKRQ